MSVTSTVRSPLGLALNSVASDALHFEDIPFFSNPYYIQPGTFVLAQTFDCTITGVERAPEFVAAARERVARAGLEARIEIVEADAAAYP